MLDVADSARASRAFYRRHHLAELADLIPKKPTVSSSLVEFGIRSGFYCAFAFPGWQALQTHFERLVEQTARVGSDRLADNQQYRPPVLTNVVQRENGLAGRENGPYLLLFSPAPQENCWGKTAGQIEEQFQARGWQGLTVPEYLVLQRVFAEQYGDHRFHEEPLDASGGHWLWLIDSMNENECSAAMSRGGVVNVQAVSRGNRDSRRAALAAVVVPLNHSSAG